MTSQVVVTRLFLPPNTVPLPVYILYNPTPSDRHELTDGYISFMTDDLCYNSTTHYL